MTTEEWELLIDEAAAMGVRMVQFIGGEPTVHPGLARLVRHAVTAGLKVEVFSNLLYVSADQWAALELPGVSLATSWYSPDPKIHARITGSANGARMRELVASIPAPRAKCKPDDGDDDDSCKPKQDGGDCAPAEREACGPSYCNPDLRR